MLKALARYSTLVPANSILFPFDKSSSTASSDSKVTNPKPRDRLEAWSRMIWCSFTTPNLEKKSLNSSAVYLYNKNALTSDTLLVKSAEKVVKQKALESKLTFINCCRNSTNKYLFRFKILWANCTLWYCSLDFNLVDSQKIKWEIVTYTWQDVPSVIKR